MSAHHRAARFRCVIALAQAGQYSHPKIFNGTCEGRIEEVARGENGFGYDPLFVPEGHEQTFGELGVPRKQIFLAGFSCGGWASLLVMSQYPEKIAGIIAFMPACYGWVSKNGIKKQTSYVPGFMPLREKEINITIKR